MGLGREACPGEGDRGVVGELGRGIEHVESVARHKLQGRVVVAVTTVQARRILALLLRVSMSGHGSVMAWLPRTFVVLLGF